MNDENNEKGKNKIMDKCDETIKWLHVKQLAEVRRQACKDILVGMEWEVNSF